MDRSMMLRRRCPRPMPRPTWKPSASGPRWATTDVIAVRRLRSIGLAGSKLNLPEMPHMSGRRQLGLSRFDHAATCELGDVQGFERRDHAVERIARERLCASRI